MMLAQIKGKFSSKRHEKHFRTIGYYQEVKGMKNIFAP